MRYQLEFPRNKVVLCVHVDQQLTDKNMEMYYGREHMDTASADPAPIWLKEMYDIDGIVGMSFIQRYELHIEKAKVFSWDDLAPQIVEILRRYLSPEGEATETAEPKRWTAADELEYQRSERMWAGLDSVFGED
ncbi:MAG TPA: hypothetical protein VMR99_00245 [Candidatus Paceibacterota bacterium]|nr:hypothetical protein [Candidatus Paceibacterota bacterium]